VVEGPQTRVRAVCISTNAPARAGTSRGARRSSAAQRRTTQPDRAREWAFGGRCGVVRNRCAAAIVRVLNRVGAGPAHGRIERVFGGREAVWRALAGHE
jgi:hypothetical protein